MFKDFFACRIVLAANHHYPGNIQRRFRLQNCLSLKSSISRNTQSLFRLQNCLTRKSLISRKFSKTFLACRTVLPANHQYPGNIQRLFCLQKCPGRKSSVSQKYPKTFSPEELSQPQIFIIPKILIVFSPAELFQPQINNIPEIFKDFFACRVVLAANLLYLGNIQTKDVFACRIVSASNYLYPGNIQRLFCLQKCRSRKSSIPRKYPKTSSPAELSQQQIIGFPKYSKTFSPAELSQPKTINIRELFKNFFACRIGLAANHQYPGNIQRLFRLQNSTRSKSSKSRKYLKIFLPAELSQPQIISIPEICKDVFACRIVLAANLHYPENTQSLFACRIVLAANQQYPGNIQRLFRLQIRLSRKSSLSRKYPKTFSLAELSQPQIINIPKILKDFFACRNVLPASH